MGLTEIKKELNKFDKGKLIEIIADLYKKNKEVKSLLDFYANPNEAELFDKYREKVREAFYPKRGSRFKLKDGKSAISDFKKRNPSATLVADLMLYYVETGVEFTDEVGSIDDAFYTSLESTYLAALKLMQKEHLLDHFAQRNANLIKDSIGIGWGFYDYLCSVYADFYGETGEK